MRKDNTILFSRLQFPDHRLLRRTLHRSVILLIFLYITINGSSQTTNKQIQSGNDYYKQQQFDKAAEEYNKALTTEPNNQTAKFNQANTLYKQNKKVEAAQLFAEVAGGTAPAELRSKAFYNKGVILSQQKNLVESIEAYKNTLRLNPDDKDARENLQKALLELKNKKQPKKKDEQDKKKKQQDQQKQPQSKLSPKETEQRLKLLEQKEKEVQERVQKSKSKTGGNQTKDW